MVILFSSVTTYLFLIRSHSTDPALHTDAVVEISCVFINLEIVKLISSIYIRVPGQVLASPIYSYDVLDVPPGYLHCSFQPVQQSSMSVQAELCHSD